MIQARKLHPKKLSSSFVVYGGKVGQGKNQVCKVESLEDDDTTVITSRGQKEKYFLPECIYIKTLVVGKSKVHLILR